MHEVEEKTKKLCELKDEILCHIGKVKDYENCESIVGEMVDMVKDLCEAEEKLWKACYYKTVVKAMKEHEEEEEKRYDDLKMMMAPMGYNTRRYASGRYAPSGKGHISGYVPHMAMDPYINSMMHDPDFEEMLRDGRFGYSSGDNRGGRETMSNMPSTSRNGMMYDQWDNARRHYHETGKESDKREMDQHAMDHVDNAIDTFREIWKTADPALKKEMKGEISKLASEMVV